MENNKTGILQNDKVFDERIEEFSMAREKLKDVIDQSKLIIRDFDISKQEKLENQEKKLEEDRIALEKEREKLNQERKTFEKEKVNYQENKEAEANLKKEIKKITEEFYVKSGDLKKQTNVLSESNRNLEKNLREKKQELEIVKLRRQESAASIFQD